jgi:hypothetical protein
VTENKIVPITGKHTTFSSMLAEAMADPRAKRGFVVYFDEEGTMYPGHVDTTRSDACMGAAYLNMIAIDIMRQDD